MYSLQAHELSICCPRRVEKCLRLSILRCLLTEWRTCRDMYWLLGTCEARSCSGQLSYLLCKVANQCLQAYSARQVQSQTWLQKGGLIENCRHVSKSKHKVHSNKPTTCLKTRRHAFFYQQAPHKSHSHQTHGHTVGQHTPHQTAQQLGRMQRQNLQLHTALSLHLRMFPACLQNSPAFTPKQTQKSPTCGPNLKSKSAQLHAPLAPGSAAQLLRRNMSVSLSRCGAHRATVGANAWRV